MLSKAVLFGGAAFLFINIVAAVVILPVLVDLVAPADELADLDAAIRSRWLIIPIELASLLGAFAGPCWPAGSCWTRASAPPAAW